MMQRSNIRMIIKRNAIISIITPYSHKKKRGHALLEIITKETIRLVSFFLSV